MMGLNLRSQYFLLSHWFPQEPCHNDGQMTNTATKEAAKGKACRADRQAGHLPDLRDQHRSVMSLQAWVGSSAWKGSCTQPEKTEYIW